MINDARYKSAVAR